MTPPATPTAEWTGPFRRRLGELELAVVTDRTYRLDGGAFFGVVPKTLWSRQAPCDADNCVRAAMNSLLVRVADKLVLIETGAGNKLDERQMRNWGVDPRRDFLDRLAAAGFAAESIDLVVNTHLHYDHCGWNTLRQPDGALAAAFPRAQYLVQRQELEHARARHERDRVSYLPDNYEPLIAAGRMLLLDGEQEILPGLSLLPLAGHTRGMQAVLLRSGGETACYISDLMPTHWHCKPGWVMGFDLFPLESVDNKRRILERAVRERWLMVFTHDPLHVWGYIDERAGNYEFRPA